jgi:thiosulfate dehydrogenase [quinone] large subunit
MAGNPTIDLLNVLGLTLVGLALLVGAFVRFSAFWGGVMMFFYWLAALEGGLLAGLPLAHGWVVDDHLVYVFLLFGLGASGAGRILGVDAWLEETSVVENNLWLKYLLG